MTNLLVKKILQWTGATVLLLLVVLSVHIYMVTRTKPPDAHTLIMARIDIKEKITQDQASQITAWMYGQKGMDHVICNAANRNIVFTYYPIQTSGDRITSDFKSAFPIKADRYMPSAQEMTLGCPVAATSPTYKVYNFIKNIF